MSLRLNDLKPALGASSSRARVGRGIGSGLGKTAGRGHKGSLLVRGGEDQAWFLKGADSNAASFT